MKYLALTPQQQQRQQHPRVALPFVSLVLIAALSACSSTPPTAQMAVSKAAVERADTSAAVDAPVEVAAARQKLSLANAAFANKDFELARRLAEQAEADAALAESQARSVRSARALAEVREGIRQLRDEMSRK
ncbi:DUF4398 domain-containing protein [Paucibacter sp. B2R-40]|uniref:DUF4398 domain-containing protein n=1 Tax=Paucibacter sp. B2R-40 TaxID=2893554 RepID=UPI0021E4C134|nr:DUF4398 domain-containing protein [Paucibacter sp. B2R-40]MCV2356460.1 DUF4398 domain-containing protein [Paucibacter sp. B2R-40]